MSEGRHQVDLVVVVLLLAAFYWLRKLAGGFAQAGRRKP
jgi:hypothetical protein